MGLLLMLSDEFTLLAEPTEDTDVVGDAEFSANELEYIKSERQKEPWDTT
jgi:hypothetical protein